MLCMKPSFEFALDVFMSLCPGILGWVCVLNRGWTRQPVHVFLGQGIGSAREYHFVNSCRGRFLAFRSVSPVWGLSSSLELASPKVVASAPSCKSVGVSSPNLFFFRCLMVL